ncbi:putative DNA modification/repair radical SAM protein [Pelagicoccus sp. SDUM812002]|uniref:putative DNA modification/repair radical SAM protein n=1 Tax=Pelagicoccus sp. SDUM812002 TaxID=3041266 RepID=UPI00280EEC3F|nr:putative DNA modification/repair radical SAM protein [Pelagicoccus sp. SDUM812002]MDQ8184866.1 putative DNA modification/repair radical SAM protein [Pelagicoccus sp. SDUM812002]
MELERKLEILADAAKYDASCASSGGERRKTSAGMKGVGSTTGSGICHSYAPDGRCISLLKILLTNVCIFDCMYCVNRRSSDTPRAAFTPEEVVGLTLDFYKRNYIEGLFLSSGIIRNPDYTMEQLVRVARTLRVDHGFRGYVHLKTIPEASPELIEEAGRWADRLSVNVELPTQEGLEKLAPEKNLRRIQGGMARIREIKEDDLDRKKKANTERQRSQVSQERSFAPAGQSTQMIVGADDANDRAVLFRADTLYKSYQLRRVYYSAYSPIPHASVLLPPKSPPLVRENRLYQADWLLRFYGFSLDEIVPKDLGDLPLDLDPKSAWALRHREFFPVDVNTASREALLRVPGLGVRNAERILEARRFGKLSLADLRRLRLPLAKASPFIVAADHSPGLVELSNSQLRVKLGVPAEQLLLPLSRS